MWSRGSASRRVRFGVLIKSPLTVGPAGAAPRRGPGCVVYEKQNAAAAAEFLCLTALDDRPRVAMATAAVRGERGGSGNRWVLSRVLFPRAPRSPSSGRRTPRRYGDERELSGGSLHTPREDPASSPTLAHRRAAERQMAGGTLSLSPRSGWFSRTGVLTSRDNMNTPESEQEQTGS
ncbi:unnamed protein product [Arctogadus glacialis]